jgi:spermidine/putrescine transport system ATP-binding protein
LQPSVQSTASTIDVQLSAVSKAYAGSANAEPVLAVDDISLEITQGEFFALLGPSGCGKTTTLRLIAGFEIPSQGEIVIAGKPVQGVPAFQRPVNTVFQDYALFPHMNILSNVMFGLKMAKVPRKEARERAHEALELVQLPNVAKRKPHQLSGGQRQRIALARALVNRPKVLLLDEPLGALDLKLRKAMQFELKTMQQQVGITFIFVTHDQEEAMTMADRIAVMNQGHVLQVGSPSEIYETPQDRFVADFIGETNFISATVQEMQGSHCQLVFAGGLVVPAYIDENHAVSPNQQITLAIRPEKITLQADDQASPFGENTVCVRGRIEEALYIGTDTRYSVRVGDDLVVARVQNLSQRFATMRGVGEDVNVCWDKRSANVLVN